ncbi:hypothetical protein KP509_29G055100 [Ceratopteris richardii]|nr:hypothetical protein KP509_29G055100 [Ceratopteris richardii]
MEKMGAFLRPNAHTFIILLKACAKLNDIEKGIELHKKIAAMDMLETDPFVGSSLVEMYSKCGCISNAHKVFYKIIVRDVIAWTTLIKGYVDAKNSDSALQCFDQMQSEGILPDSLTMVSILKACGIRRDVKKGQKLHAQIVHQYSPELIVYFGTALVDMYSKCGHFSQAWCALKEVKNRDAAVWNPLLQGYLDYAYDGQTLECLRQMQSERISPNAVTFMCCLKACIGMKTIDKGQKVHIELEKLGLLEQNVYMGSVLVDMYGKFSLLAEAQHVFNKIECQNIVSWTTLIRGYAEHGYAKEALSCFEKMQVTGIDPNPFTFISALLACGTEGFIEKGLEIHAEICRRDLHQNVYIGSSLIDLYTKFGLLIKAREVFDRLLNQDVVSWNALIAGYVEHDHADKALACYEQMQAKKIAPNEVTYVCALKAYAVQGAVHMGIELHADIERQGFATRTLFLGSVLINMYANLFLLSKAQDVFDKLSSQDLVTWNSLILGYAEKGYGEKALECYEEMRLKSFTPDSSTFVCTLKACASIAAVEKSQHILAEIERHGMLGKDIALANILIHTLCKCDLLYLAQQVFDRLPFRNVVTWTALVAGHIEHGCSKQALQLFQQMQLEGVTPNALTYAVILKACGDVGALIEGQELHNDIQSQGLLEGDLVIGRILIDMYAGSGSPFLANQVFDALQIRDVFSWTALLTALSEHGHDREVLNCFQQMKLEGVFPDALTVIPCLRACGNLGALDMGEELHGEIERRGLLVYDCAVGNTLVDMYAKSGNLSSAQVVFDKLPNHDVVSWTALIAGYAQFGDVDNSCITFNKMMQNGVRPDSITFLVLLSACGRSGLVSKTQMYYEAMSKEYGIVPSLEHQACIVNCFGQAGHTSMILGMLEQIPTDATVWWHTVLCACRMSGNVDFGHLAFACAVQ